MKGIAKAIKRTPHLMTSKVGMSKKSNDPEFDEYHRKFTSMESSIEKLLKDTKAYSENVNTMLQSGQQWSIHFANIFRPLSGEFDIAEKHPAAGNTLQNTDIYQATMEELKEALAPELELIQTKIYAPAKELQGILKQIRKTITKRDHKLTDFDRFTNSLTKLRDKKEKSLSDEKNLFKLEQEYEVASNEYEHYNNMLKTEMPQFMVLATQFIDPLFHSFYYMQLNIFYIMVEKLQGFADGKYTVPENTQQMLDEYHERLGESQEQVEGLGITKRITSTAKMMATARAGGGSTLGRANTSASTSTNVSGVSRSTSSFVKKPPPPPPSATTAAPPPYSPAPSSLATATKRAPPPPPPLKPKPKPAVQYVVALYDFQAQADGDLDFMTGDRIEIVERTPSQEDWWTGKLNGRQGVFPGNYVQEA
ncbi:BAR-domain-containing protein [Hysterangium stoloniferum]|nr:BAR-domain-containing protein [Hysterangium stoloniferum]